MIGWGDLGKRLLPDSNVGKAELNFRPQVLVSYDADDHGWQFIGTSEASMADARVVGRSARPDGAGGCGSPAGVAGCS